MHILQPKHTKLKPDEVTKLLDRYNISLSQIPKISVKDAAVPDGCVPGDVLKIERKDGEKVDIYFRTVVL